GDGHVAPTTTPTTINSNQTLRTCANPMFTCHGGQITAHMAVPMTWTVPSIFSRDLHYSVNTAADTPLLVEAYWRDKTPTGVTVAENAVAATPSASADPDPTAATGAHAFATWLSQRPYLQSSPVQRTTLDGLT